MPQLRRWLLQPTDPYHGALAADARLSLTDYADDQVWTLHGSGAESPALALQTSYGGRAGLVSILPLWSHDGRTIYETNAYAHPPQVTAFAPGYLRVQGSLTLQLALQVEYWAMDSHAIGARITLSNAHVDPAAVHLDLFAHIGAGGKEQPPRPFKQASAEGLHFGQLGDLNPVLLLEGGATGEVVPGITPKLGRDLVIEGRKKLTLRWVHAARPTATESLSLAQLWLNQDWDRCFKQVISAAGHIPVIETGDEATDAALAAAWQQLVGAFLKPTESLPHASFVALRQPRTGFSRFADPGLTRREWSGQPPTLAYPTALAMATVDPALAQGVVRNYLAVQRDDGWIDYRPGLGGQRADMLCMPILARLAWGIFHYTEDADFLREVFPGLLSFFKRWLAQDADGDDLPEWSHEAQTGYIFFPTFAAGQPWGEGADIALVETPDLLAYLISEAMSLRAIAYYFHDSDAEAELDEHLARLRSALEELWRDGHYGYHDRDTHRAGPHRPLLVDGRGDQEYLLAEILDPPGRVVVRIQGGVDHTPRLKLILEGLDADGEPISEQVDSDAFVWQHNRGAYTSRAIFARLDRARCQGLSRVYHVDIYTPDLTRLDLNALLPLWSAALPPERAAPLVGLLTDPDVFWRPNGVTLCAATDPSFDPANADGAGGVWPFWITLMGEALLETGHESAAADLLRRTLQAQMAVLKAGGGFTEFYHSDEARGVGEVGHLAGLIPLHLLLRVLGVRIIGSDRVWTGGPYTWGSPVTITQRDVQVTRSAEETVIRFPSGHAVTLPASADWQEVIDPAPVAYPAVKPIRPAASGKKRKTGDRPRKGDR